MPPSCYARTDCRLCGSAELDGPKLRLAPTPPANQLCDSVAASLGAARYPLELYQCRTCGHVQLGAVVDHAEVFANYPYASGFAVAHWARYAAWAAKVAGLRAGDLAVDVGSNDGGLLAALLAMAPGLRVCGVEPSSDHARQAAARGVRTVCAPLSLDVAADLVAAHGPAKLVTANHVLAHVDDWHGIVSAARNLLAPDGLLVVEVAHLRSMLRCGAFDSIYHEHLDYHDARSLRAAAACHGLTAIWAEVVDYHGGSLRMAFWLGGTSALDGHRGVGLVFLGDLAEESPPSDDVWAAFRRRIAKRGDDLRAAISAASGPVVGYGAPAKAVTLLHHFGLAEDLIAIVDDEPRKHGRYLPGTTYKIVPDLPADTRDVVILAWNCAEQIKRAHAGAPVRWIVP